MIWLALGTVYVVWGSTYLAIAYAVQTLPPFVAAGTRFVIAGALLAGWLAVRDRAALRVTRRELGGAAVVGGLLLAGGNGLVMVGERTVPSGFAALIVASVPLWIVTLRAVAGDRARPDVLLGVLTGLVGVAVLVVPGGLGGTTDMAGVAALLGATLSWSLGTFLSQRIAMPRDALASTALQMLVGGVAAFALALPTGDLARLSSTTPSTASLAGLAYLIVFGSLVAFSAYTWVLQHAPVSLVATYAYVNPVVAVFLGWLFLREPITPSMLGGAVLIVAAVMFIVARSGRPSGTASPRVRTVEASAAGE